MSYQLYNNNVPVTPIEHLNRGREHFGYQQEPYYPQSPSPQRRAPHIKERFSSVQGAADVAAPPAASTSSLASDELKQIKYLLIGVIVLLLLLLILRR